MRLIIKIAWRNIMRHRGKSLVIGTILFIGAFLMTLGNGMIGGMEKGLSQNIVNGFTGDVVLVAKEQQSDNVFLEFMGKAVEPINGYPAVRDVLAKQDYVKRYLPVGKNTAMVLNEEGGSPEFCFVIGADIEKYQQMFPGSIKVVEGEMLKPGESGVLMPTGARREMFGTTGVWFIAQGTAPDTATMGPEARKLWPNALKTRDQVVFMGMNDDNTTTDIRAPIRAVIKYRALNTIWGKFVTLDIESYRRCLGYFAASDMTGSLSEGQKKLLEMDNESLDDMFGTGALDQMSASTAVAAPVVQASVLPAPAVDIESGTYNLVFVLLKDGVTPEVGAKRLNEALRAADVPVRALSWRKATGMIGSMTQIIKGALFLFVMLLFVVAIIIIINTLSMAAIERVPEIGMMRAVGARKSFVSLMFLGETATLSFVFGGIGVLAGLLVVNLVPLFNITSQNDMIQLLFGGDTLHPILAFRDVVLVVAQLTLVTVLAVIYPLLIARNITPLDAISRE